MSGSQVGFAKWLLVFLSTYALTDALLVGLVGTALGIAMGHLVISFLLLMVAGAVASALVYWARKVRDEPRLWALRFAVSVFVFFVLFMSAVMFSAAQDGFLPRADLLSHFILLVLPGSMIGSVSVYIVVRIQLLSAIAQNGAGRPK